MAVEPITAYRVVCDGCGKEFEYDLFIMWSRAEDAAMMATDSDWIEVAGLMFCDECGDKAVCECGHGFGEHDYDEMNPCEMTEEGECECRKFTLRMNKTEKEK